MRKLKFLGWCLIIYFVYCFKKMKWNEKWIKKRKWNELRKDKLNDIYMYVCVWARARKRVGESATVRKDKTPFTFGQLAKQAHFLCEILRESSTKEHIHTYTTRTKKKKFTHIIKIRIIWLEGSLKTQF